MDFDKIMDYVTKNGEAPEDNLHYTKVDAVLLDGILSDCLLFVAEAHENYTEMLFRHINNADWFSLRIYGADDFQISHFIVGPGEAVKLAIRGLLTDCNELKQKSNTEKEIDKE